MNLNFDEIEKHQSYNEICKDRIIFIDENKYNKNFYENKNFLAKLINDIEYKKDKNGNFSILNFIGFLMEKSLELNNNIYDSLTFQFSFLAVETIKKLHSLGFISKKFDNDDYNEADEKTKQYIKSCSIKKDIWIIF